MAVGPATAATARALGFLNVSESPGEGVVGLARHARATLAPNNGALLHPAGIVTAGDLQLSLQPHGFIIRKEAIYEARAAETISGALIAELGAGSIAAAMFFSPRTARLFATLIGAADLAPACRAVTAFALSEAVANALAPLAFQGISVAGKPTMDAMLELTGPP
jgi:uroporphyrinogen-III synthase